MTPLIAIDIGNSTTNLALFHNPHSQDILKIKTLQTSLIKSGKLSVNEIRDLLHQIGDRKYSVFVSSVVPEVDSLVRQLFEGLNAYLISFLNAHMDTIIKIDDNFKNSIGSDRIATMASAFTMYKTHVAVADFGTATTLSVVNKGGYFVGSAIMPGLDMMFESLYKKTSKLPFLKRDDHFQYPHIDTSSAIQSGIIIGTAGAIERIVKDIEKVNGFKLKLVLTGGGGEFMSKFIRRSHELKSHLIFQGMRLIYLRNYHE